MTAFLVVVGLTGALLPFKVELERLVNPQLFASPEPGQKRLDVATLAERAEAIAPQAQVDYFFTDVPDQVAIRCSPRKNPATGEPYEIDFDHLLLNPYTGAELGRRRDGDILQGRVNIVPFLYRLHTSLACGEWGVWFLGMVSLAWTLDCFVGFYLTLPPGRSRFWRRWKSAWLVNWRSGAYRLNFDLHRAGGLWVWPLLFVFAWSGVMFNLRPVYDRVTGTVLDYQSWEEQFASVPAHPAASRRLDWRAAVARGQQLMEEQAARGGFSLGRPTCLAYIDSFGVYSYSVESSLDVRAHDGAGVWLDADTGELRMLFLPRGEHAGNTVGEWLWALHFGDVKGVRAYRFLVSAVGLLTVMLAVTGVYLWWKKRTKRSGRG